MPCFWGKDFHTEKNHFLGGMPKTQWVRNLFIFSDRNSMNLHYLYIGFPVFLSGKVGSQSLIVQVIGRKLFGFDTNKSLEIRGDQELLYLHSSWNVCFFSSAS